MNNEDPFIAAFGRRRQTQLRHNLITLQQTLTREAQGEYEQRHRAQSFELVPKSWLLPWTRHEAWRQAVRALVKQVRYAAARIVRECETEIESLAASEVIIDGAYEVIDEQEESA